MPPLQRQTSAFEEPEDEEKDEDRPVAKRSSRRSAGTLITCSHCGAACGSQRSHHRSAKNSNVRLVRRRSPLIKERDGERGQTGVVSSQVAFLLLAFRLLVAVGSGLYHQLGCT